GKLVLPAKQDRDALVVRQLGQGLLDLLFQLFVQEGVRRGKAFHVFKLVSGPVFWVLRVQRLSAVTRAPADFVEAQIPRDGEEPGGEFGGSTIAMGGPVNLNEDILREVFRLGCVAESPIN